ncbi:hypothetical protein [Corynebacterium guangdongense]|uniref:Glycosyltransferase RgtA/B/C/D-like domain-containing protein n=1 Tax=Corynebacterium guangdongense TaxID=1783348 RepID=A0ABU2A2I9_9CORY|nr:hypothetical protein [Corynebacterium guangdongense]MDR7330838.1 hypothetical protein [Corynebacterium guangdongense]WJZ16853.1 hypothetical protein CGUA_01265 [Corynebacterium guangdongense]
MTQSRQSARPHLVAVLLVLLAGTVLRTAVAARGWFYWDDLTLLARAREFSWPAPDLLLAPHDGHLMPGAWLIYWLLGAATEGYSWAAAVATLGLLNLLALAAVGYAAWVVARRHAWWVTLLYAVTPLALPVATWLAAAVNSLPLHAGTAVILAHGWLAMTRREKRDPLIVAATVLLTGLFSERVLLLAPAAVLLVLAWAWARRIELRAAGRLVLAVAVPWAIWLAAYLGLVGDPRVSRQAGDVGDFLVHGYGLALLPTLVGGPLQWDRWHPGPPFAQPPATVVIAGVLAAVVLVVVVAVRNWRGLASLAIVFAYPLLPLLAIAFARNSADTAAEITQTLRHVAEVAVLLTLTLGVLATHLSALRRWLIGIYVVLSLISTVTYAQVWREQPARDYFTTLAAEVEAPLLDQATPLEVLLPVVHPYNMLSRLTDYTASSTSSPALVDADGHPRPAVLMPIRTVGETCLEGPTRVPLDGPLLERDWVLRLNYLAAADGEASVAIGDGRPLRVPVTEGLHQVHVQLIGGGDSLVIEGVDCIGLSEIGLLMPE